MKTIAVNDLHKTIHNIEGIQIIDIRTPVSFKEGHIPEAVNIPRSSFTKKIKQIDPSRPVLIYCEKGIESDNVGLYLEKIIKAQTFVLHGGYRAYIEAL